LHANEENFLKNPMLWRDVLLKFHAVGAGAALAESLRASLEPRAGDWRGRLTLAEMQLAQADWAGAEHWLWQIIAIPPEAPGPAPLRHQLDGLVRRVRHLDDARQSRGSARCGDRLPGDAGSAAGSRRGVSRGAGQAPGWGFTGRADRELRLGPGDRQASARNR